MTNLSQCLDDARRMANEWRVRWAVVRRPGQDRYEVVERDRVRYFDPRVEIVVVFAPGGHVEPVAWCRRAA